MRRILPFLFLSLGLLAGLPRVRADVDDEPPPFPRPGSNIPGPFHFLNVTGPREDRYHSLVVRHGLAPVVAVFVRPQVSGDKLEDWMKNLDEGQPLAVLLKKVDDVKVNNPDAIMGSFAIYAANENKEEEQLKNKLRTLPEKLGLTNMVQGIADKTRQDGMKPWEDKVDDDKKPEINVILYNNHKVLHTWTFGKDKPLTEKDAETIATELDKLIPAAQRPGQKATLKIKPRDKEKEPEPKEKPKEKEKEKEKEEK